MRAEHTFPRVEVRKDGLEIRRGQVVRHTFFTVSCLDCRDILLSGKWLGDDFEDLIWRAIRSHAAEHEARQLSGDPE